MQKDSIIRGVGITKSYGSLQVLKSVDLEIKRNEVVAITGASGAGKSTLLHILGTLDQPDSGEVFINDKLVSELQGNKLARFRNSNIGFIFQAHHLLPEFTALENVSIPAYISGSKRSEAESRAKELLSFLNLSDRINHKPAEMSGGEQQRVAVARALMNKPDIIFADEPSGNLDSNHANELHNLFFKLRDEFNQTFVIVTHNPLLAEMSDRKIEMIDGLIPI